MKENNTFKMPGKYGVMLEAMEGINKHEAQKSEKKKLSLWRRLFRREQLACS